MKHYRWDYKNVSQKKEVIIDELLAYLFSWRASCEPVKINANKLDDERFLDAIYYIIVCINSDYNLNGYERAAVIELEMIGNQELGTHD